MTTSRPNPTHSFRRFAAIHLGLASLLSTALAQTTPAPTPSATATSDASRKSVPVESTVPASTSETIVLSPFEVVNDTKGYYSANTMSGTRFNSRIDDLAASLSVVTKEQMQDFAMLDINDVFLYTANTEGTGTFTDYTMDRNGQLTDNVQGNPTQANRVRGISSANVSYGNFETQGRVPLDPLIMDGVEISRGPNANVFGLGNASGTVNQVPVSANLTRDFTHIQLRGDSDDGYRSTLDINRVLFRNKLAIRASGSFQHDGFVRKPSGVNTERYNFMGKFSPFKNTTISAAYLHYRMNGNRPNFTPPRDYVSSWLAAGRPSWDPLLQVVHLNGQTIGNGGVGTTTPITADANVPDYFTRAGAIQTRSNIYVDQSGLAYWTTNNTNTTTSNPFTPAANNQSVRLMQTSAGAGTASLNGGAFGRITNQPLFTTTPSVSDKSIYVWSEVNLSSVNRLMDRTDTYNLQLDQLFFNTPHQTLAGQVGFFREDSQRYKRTPIGDSGNSGQSGQLFADPNERLLDGSTNPFFGRTYIGAAEPLVRSQPSKWDTYRAQLAYKLDLRDNPGFFKWLGVQQLSVYDEYKYRVSRQYAFRDALVSNHSWTATGLTGFAANQARGVQSNVTGGPQAGANVVRGYYRYYVGDNNGGNVDYAPSEYKYGSYPFVWGGYTLAGGVPVAGSGVFVRDPAELAQVATTDGTGGTNNLKQVIKTPGVVLQSHFLDDRFVTTFGLREDKVYSKNGYTPVQLVNGVEHDYANDNHWAAGDYRFNSGKTKTAQFVVRPFRDIALLNQAVTSGGLGSFFADAVRGMNLFYNRSDNFVPQAPAVDLFLRPLPNITGKGTDYGVSFNIANKLSVRINHYDNKQINARDGDANTVAQRVLRLDLDISADAYQLFDRADAWTRLKNPAFTDQQVRDSVATQMQLPIAQYDALINAFRAGTIAATNDIVAKGTEIELNFNPTNYWTVAASATEKRSISTNVSKAVQQWIDIRLPVWTSIVDPNTDPTLGTGQSQGWAADATNPNHLWWLHNYGGAQTASQNYASFVDAPYKVIKEQEGKSKPSIRRYDFRVSTSYQLAGLTTNPILKKFKVGGSIRWEDKGAIGYFGKQSLPASITDLNPNRPIYDKAHAYFDGVVSYRTKLWADRINTTLQLNVRNIQESGRLQPIGAFPDGTPNAYRIVDPRQFILTASFDL